MTTTIGTVELIAKIDTGAYKKGAKEIEGANDDIEKSADDAAKKTGRAFDGAAKVATGAMITAAALVTAAWVNSASEIQSLRASFESLTGNVDSTNEVMTTLYDLGKKTAFSNKDIQAAGRSFLATGVEVGDLNTLMSQTADIAGATGADLGRLTTPLTQAIARGKLQTQDFYQILDAGAGALRQPLTELAGNKGFGSLAEAMEEGAITSDDLLTVMGQVTKEGGFAFEGAIKQSETFNGRMSNLQEAVTNFGLDLLGVDAVTGQIDPSGVFAKMSDAISTTTDFLTKNGGMIKQVGTVIAILLLPAIISLGVQGLIAGAGMAAGILLALGPIGLIVAAVTAAVYLIIANWDTVKGWLSAFWGWLSNAASQAWDGVKAVFSGVVAFFATVFGAAWSAIKAVFGFFVGYYRGLWNGVTDIFGGAAGWFSNVFQGAWNGIKNVFSGVGSFFSGVWDTIVSIFGSVGTAVGNAIGNAFKGVINSVLRGAANIINGFVDAINGAIGAINKIPGVNIGTLGRMHIPQLAEGGIVSSATLAVIGEGSEPEAVIPLSKLDKMLEGNGGGKSAEYNIGTINIGSEVDGERWLQRLTGDSEITSHGLVPTQSYMGAR